MTMIPFFVKPEIMERTKENRLMYFEQQIAESQISIVILQKNVETFNRQEDIINLAKEESKLAGLIFNYRAVEGVEINDTEPSNG